MSKKLNIIEAMKMPVGTLFEVILNGEEFGCIAKILESSVQSKKQLVWDNRANSSIVVTDSISRAIFTPIQQPVSFMEAIKASQEGKTIWVNVEDKTYTYYPNPRDKQFDELRAKETRGGLSTYEILNGKWYIKD